MKKLILFSLFSVFYFACKGQESNLDGQWFLEKLSLDGVTYPAPMPTPGSKGLLPQINFYLNENFMSATVKPCDNGPGCNISINGADEEFTVLDAFYLVGDCTPLYTNFPTQYFGFLDNQIYDETETFSYEIINETNEINTLIITDQVGDFAKYSNVMMPYYLYKTWELSSLTINGEASTTPESDGSFLPTITFYETNNPQLATYSGNTGCNLFEGSNLYDIEAKELSLSSFDVVLSGECESTDEYTFEGQYIDFLGSDPDATFLYTVTESETLNTLELYKSNGDIAVYNIELLDTPSFKRAEFIIYPNPTSDFLFISSENSTIEKISIFNIAGQRISEQNANLETINVSELQNGIYFIEITTKNGNAVKQFIKK